MKTRSYEQLERHYNRIDANNFNEVKSLYERILDAWWGSSSPKDTIRSYYFELNREGRRHLLGLFANGLRPEVFQTMLEQLDIIE